MMLHARNSVYVDGCNLNVFYKSTTLDQWWGFVGLFKCSFTLVQVLYRLPFSKLNQFHRFLLNVVCNWITLDHFWRVLDVLCFYVFWFKLYMFVHSRNSIYVDDRPLNFVYYQSLWPSLRMVLNVSIVYSCWFNCYVFPRGELNLC